MFKPGKGTCTKCGNDTLIVVKAGLCGPCNHRKKQSNKIGSGRDHGLSEPTGQCIEGFTTVFRAPIRKKKLQSGRKGTSKDQVREKVHFGKTNGLPGVKLEHTRVYMLAFGYTIADYVPCEITGQRCSDIHHIYARGMGGSDLEDELYNRIENLMGLTREAHTEYGDKEQYYDMLIEKHFAFLSDNGIKYDKKFFDKWK